MGEINADWTFEMLCGDNRLRNGGVTVILVFMLEFFWPYHVYTPENNMEPENAPLEKEKHHHFLGRVLVFGGYHFQTSFGTVDSVHNFGEPSEEKSHHLLWFGFPPIFLSGFAKTSNFGSLPSTICYQIPSLKLTASAVTKNILPSQKERKHGLFFAIFVETKKVGSGSWNCRNTILGEKTVLGSFIALYFGSGFWITLTP